MPPVTKLDLEDLPDSPHARELRIGLDRLRFEPPLERDYVRRRLEGAKTRVRTFASLALLLSLALTAGTVVRDGGWSVTVAAHVLLVVPLTVLLVGLALHPQFPRFYMAGAQLIAPGLSALAGIFAAETIGRGSPEDLAIPPLVMIAIFMFMGLLFRAALITGVVAVGAFAIAGLAFAIPPLVFVKGVSLLAVTGLVAAVISRDAELHQRQRFLEEALIGELVERDPLTGLKNRRAFDAHLHRVWQHCLREGRLLGLLFIDIDYFKRYNDEYGHQAGDAALQRVGAATQRVARRPFDMAARFGGEEFCVVLFDAASEDVLDVAETLRRAVEGLQIAHRASGCAAVVTVSIGAAIVQPGTGQTPQTALRLADEALYRAKDAGRNRTEILVAPGQSPVFGNGPPGEPGGRRDPPRSRAGGGPDRSRVEVTRGG